jgi:catechol 2,3-dioxygenase-like lactoylglutathione lyase family enzyme
MSITLDHVGVLVRNIDETIEFYSRVLGLNKSEKRVDRGQEFALIQISDTVAFAIWEAPERQCQHVAFALTGDEFDVIFQRIKNAGIRYGNATDGFGEDGNLYGKKLNMKGPDLEAGARGNCKSLYFEDPNGHSIEILTYEDEASV